MFLGSIIQNLSLLKYLLQVCQVTRIAQTAQAKQVLGRFHTHFLKGFLNVFFSFLLKTSIFYAGNLLL